MFCTVNLMEFICIWRPPCDLYLHVRMLILSSLSSITCLLHPYLVWEGYVCWSVMVAVASRIPQQCSGMFIVLIFQVIPFYFLMFAKIFCYNLTWKNYRREANGPTYIKSTMELSIIPLQILENSEVLAPNVLLPWVFWVQDWLQKCHDEPTRLLPWSI